jgi:hypothetical protein
VQLLEDDQVTHSQEAVPASRVRPICADDSGSLPLAQRMPGDPVDCWHEDGWWEVSSLPGCRGAASMLYVTKQECALGARRSRVACRRCLLLCLLLCQAAPVPASLCCRHTHTSHVSCQLPLAFTAGLCAPGI